MDEIEIKHEFFSDIQSQCRTCLSVGRNFVPLDKLSDIYTRITWDINTTLIEDPVRICWECEGLLRKVHRFRCQVRRANELLQLGQSFIYGTLSSLTTFVINDTHAHSIYINEGNINNKTGIKQDISSCNNSLKDNDDPFYDNDKSFNDNDNSFNDKQINDVKNDTASIRRRSLNKWAKKRALQNKKPKFKILTNKDISFDETFVEVHIGDEELRDCLKHKDSECKSKKLKCDNCDLNFSEEETFIEHKNNHNSQSEYKFCDICNKKFVNKRHLARHIRKHYCKYKCTICDYICIDKSQKRSHFVKEHRKTFQCIKCELKYGSRRDFFKHFKKWHEKFVCDHCGISFKMRYCIEDHIRKQHSPYECKPCKKQFARYNGLWLHNKTRHTESVAAYCVECDKRYEDVYRYRWHLANSSKHNPRPKIRVPCPDCDKVFTKNIYMKDHYNLVHLKFYKYRCEQCDKNFIRNADLVKHTRRVHEGVLPPKNKICYMCGRGFTSNKILSNHLRTHTGERPFGCNRCGATFAQNTALTAHTRALHTNT